MISLKLVHYIIINLNIIYFTINAEDTYQAAVVEYHPIDQPGMSEVEKQIIRAKSQIEILEKIERNLEIVLFPEKSLSPDGDIIKLSTKIPQIMDEIICNSQNEVYKDFLKLFSCASIKYNTTIAINVIEEEECTTTSKNSGITKSDTIYYNTVVVFDENGYVSGRYRKWNLFGEFQLSQPHDVDITVIRTKNNISFGIITCFDINFNIPSANLTKDLNIKNILFPNKWISELPYLTALQVQQMWAIENNVTLLAAGANNPNEGASGSGIFLGDRGPLETVFIGGEGGSKVIVQNILNYQKIDPLLQEDVDELAKELDSFFLLRDLSLDDHSSVLMTENETRIKKTVCNGDQVKLCCNFDVSLSFNNTANGLHRYVYHFVTFSGIRSFSGLRNAGIETCGIIACLNQSLHSCALRYPKYSNIFWPITFEKIVVEAIFQKDENRSQYPNSVLTSLRPISPKYTMWEKEEVNGNIRRIHTLNVPHSRLLTFGIFGRDFSRDSSLIKPKNGVESTNSSSLFLLVLGFIYIYIYFSNW